ncbi:hypothetical protein VNO80_33460 [Phaseolus coccineus]|uniref:Uncharacterized protein n=1 Tax=Phaseolus coccineus TaxID=3886 RepID=A0AAN9Q902_PHACN
MHRIRENCPATCAALPVHGCEDRADHVRDFRILQNLHRVVEAQTETLFANKHGCLLVGRQHRERDRSPKEGWQREGCVSDRSMHGAWSQPTTTSSLQLTHPRVRKTPHHETVHPPLAVGKFQPVSSAFLLPNTAREDGFDGEATGMSRCLPSGAHVCPQSETHTHDESHIFLPECIRDWVLGWCCVCMAQIFPRSHQARVSTRLTRVVFQLPKIIQADHDAKMVEGEPTQ